MNRNNKSNKWKICRPEHDKEEEQRYLKLLQNHFDGVSTYEKHPDAMMNIIFTESYQKILGPNYNKRRIGKRKEKQIKALLLERMKNKYGRWINILNFKFKNSNVAVYETNFNRVYRIKNTGILYGSPSNHLCGNIFYTSHCLERFEERVPPEHYFPVINELHRIYKTEPTSADIIVALVLCSNLEYALKDQFCYLNVRVGVLVLEILDNLFIAKTFLTEDMLKDDLQWYFPLMKDGRRDLKSFEELIEKERIKIAAPKFLLEELAEKFLDYSMSQEELYD